MVSGASDQLEVALGLCCFNKYCSVSWYEFPLSWNSFVSNEHYRFLSYFRDAIFVNVKMICVMRIHGVLYVRMYVIYSSGMCMYGRLTPTFKQDVAFIPQRLHLVCN